MAKRIYLNGRFLTQSLTGVQRHALEFTKHLDKLLSEDAQLRNAYRFVLVHPRGARYKPALKHIEIRELGFLTGNLWEQLVLPLYTFNHLLVSMCMVSCLLKRKQVVFIQDASSFVNKSFFTFAFRTWYQIAITVLGKAARHIVTISEHAKSELIKYAHIPERKLTVTYLSAKHFLEVNTSAEGEQAFLKKHALHHPYILGVSSLSPNKNFKSIVAAYKLLNKEQFPGLRLVIAGGTNPKVFQGGLEFDETVKHLGYVSDEELVYLYKSAQVFAYPSFYEGFGIPPLEAMLYNCPVIVGNTSSMPEVCGDAAFYCDPYSVEDIAVKMEQVLSLNDAERSAVIRRGKERTASFDWDKCAFETLQVVKSTD